MISVIIPAYNCEKYIKRCIVSVLAQRFANFELILVDDGSTDSTGSICDSFAVSDSRVRVIHIENSGVSAARNLGMESANGDFVCFMDSDDYVPENYLETLLDTVIGSDVAVCDVACINDGKETKRFTYDKLLSSFEAIELLLSRKSINSGPCGKLFSKDAVKNIRFPIMKAYEDILFVLAVFKNAKSIACTDRTEYIYDNSTGGTMTGYAKHPTVDVVTMSRKVFKFLDNNKGHFSDLPEYATFSHLMQHLQDISKENEKTKEQVALINEIITFFKENQKRIRNNKYFSFKEKLVYLFAARGYWLKKGFKRIC